MSAQDPRRVVSGLSRAPDSSLLTLRRRGARRAKVGQKCVLIVPFGSAQTQGAAVAEDDVDVGAAAIVTTASFPPARGQAQQTSQLEVSEAEPVTGRMGPGSLSEAEHPDGPFAVDDRQMVDAVVGHQ